MINAGSNPIPTNSPNGCQGLCTSTPTAVIAVSITVGLAVLCITICVVGSLVCCAHSHWISRRSKKTQNESDRQQHLYDEISLCGATERTVTSGRSETREENIMTLRNEAYYEVRLDRSHISTVWAYQSTHSGPMATEHARNTPHHKHAPFLPAVDEGCGFFLGSIFT